uniref:Response regulator n=1 Tax=Thermosporothrix sp. COM3 TaxID=2490863 RepID=A0A455SQY8_9CHLR|nr:response regulator [Thermosporothrix sp. COM3]
MEKKQRQPMMAHAGRHCLHADSHQKTILLIEDQVLFGKLLTRIIADRTPYQVIHLYDGSQVIQIMKEKKPHLLVLDYDLPGMNGIEIYDMIHNTHEWADIPAIMVSASLPEQEIRKRNIPGLSKPCSSQELLSAIEQVMLPHS